MPVQANEFRRPTRWPAVALAVEAAVLDLGATRHEHQPGTTFRVFLDPARHPFCLCVD